MSNDFTEMAQRVQRLPSRIKQLVDMELATEMAKTKVTVQRNILAQNNRASGALLQSIDHLDGETISGTATVKTDGYSSHVVRAGGGEAPHAPFVEYGTGIRQGTGTPNEGAQFPAPSAPPTDSIVTWMTQKGVEPREYDTIYGAAAAIAEDIARFGTKPHPYMRPAWTEHRANYSAAHARGVHKAIQRL